MEDPTQPVTNPEEVQASVEEPQVEVSQTDTPEVSPASGVVNGVIEKNDENLDESVRARIEHAEKVVDELDENGNIVGFHKESQE